MGYEQKPTPPYDQPGEGFIPSPFKKIFERPDDWPEPPTLELPVKKKWWQIFKKKTPK